MSQHYRPHPQIRHPLAGRLLPAIALFFFSLVLLVPVPVQPAPSPTATPPAPTRGLIDEGPNIRPDTSLLAIPASASPLPIRIVIPKLAINLAVTESPLVNGFWELSTTTASHGVGSANPGEPGNIVIFAHAWASLFLPLRNLKLGDTIYIFSDIRWHDYRVTEVFEVTPDQVEIIYPTAKETLTLFTCSGFADARRLVVKAVPHI